MAAPAPPRPAPTTMIWFGQHVGSGQGGRPGEILTSSLVEASRCTRCFGLMSDGSAEALVLALFSAPLMPEDVIFEVML